MYHDIVTMAIPLFGMLCLRVQSVGGESDRVAELPLVVPAISTPDTGRLCPLLVRISTIILLRSRLSVLPVLMGKQQLPI